MWDLIDSDVYNVYNCICICRIHVIHITYDKNAHLFIQEFPAGNHRFRLVLRADPVPGLYLKPLIH